MLGLPRHPLLRCITREQCSGEGKAKVRQRCLELYPDREQLYEMVYESRFQRLWEQFRGELEEL